MIRKALLGAATFLLISVVASGQIASDKAALPPAKIADPLPFKVGETLVYDIKFSRLVLNGVIGELKLTVAKPLDPPMPEMIELRAEAFSKGFFPALFGIKVKDRFTSLINQSDLAMHTSTKVLEEGKTRREQKSVINRETGLVTYTDRDLVNTKSAPKIKEKASPTWTQDILSIIYFVRSQPLKEGDVISVPVSDSGEVYNINVVAGSRQEIKAGVGKIKTIQLDAKVFDGRYLKRSGEMLVWVTDDPARIPIRARIKTSGSTITVDLKRMP